MYQIKLRQHHPWIHGVNLLTQGDLIDAIDDPQEGWQFGENITTGKSVWIQFNY